MKKRRRLKKEFIIVLIIASVIALSISLIMIINSSKDKLIGTWISEGGTIYEFKKDNEGVMKTSLSEYKFTYKRDDKTISIDFEDEKNIDIDYEYSFKESKLIMKSDRGLFTFTKK